MSVNHISPFELSFIFPTIPCTACHDLQLLYNLTLYLTQDSGFPFLWHGAPITSAMAKPKQARIRKRYSNDVTPFQINYCSCIQIAGSEFSNIWNREEWACGIFPSAWIKEQIFKFLGVIYVFVRRTDTAERYAHPIFLLGSTEGDSAQQKGLLKSLWRRLGYPWKNETWMRKMRNMENGSECFLHILPFVLCAQWPLVSLWFAYSSPLRKTPTQKCWPLEDGSPKTGWMNTSLQMAEKVICQWLILFVYFNLI